MSGVKISGKCPREARDPQRGGIIAAFFFVFMILIGFLYAISCLGNANRHGESIRDGSDAAAMGAAATFAASMNRIVLLNHLQDGLLTVGTALSSAARGFELASQAAAAARDGASASALMGWARAADARALPLANPTRAAVNAVASLNKSTGLVADRYVAALVKGWSDGEVKTAFVGARDTKRLPIADEPISVSCERVRQGWRRAFFLIADWAKTSNPAYAPWVLKGAYDSYVQSCPKVAAQIGTRIQMLPLTVASRPSTDPFSAPPFQVRAFGVGSKIRYQDQHYVEYAALGQPTPQGTIKPTSKALSQAGAAQAQFDVPRVSIAKAMWTPAWAARLSRFEPRPATQEFVRGCGAAGIAGSCATLAQAFTQGATLWNH